MFRDVEVLGIHEEEQVSHPEEGEEDQSGAYCCPDLGNNIFTMGKCKLKNRIYINVLYFIIFRFSNFYVFSD